MVLDGIAHILAKVTQELVHLVDLLDLVQLQSLNPVKTSTSTLLQHDAHSYGRPVTSEMIVVSGECQLVIKSAVPRIQTKSSRRGPEMDTIPDAESLRLDNIPEQEREKFVQFYTKILNK